MGNTERRPRPAKFQTVQAGRDIAALLVVLFHANTILHLREYGGVAPFGGFFAFGHAGVEFFFVLSGFIIFYIHRLDLNVPGKLPSFLWKRVTRIYPLFLCVMIFYTAKSLAASDFNVARFLKTVFLLPQPVPPLLPLSWTLTHEALFYCFFGLAIFNLRAGVVALALWLAAIVASAILGFGSANYLVEFVTSPYNLLFFFGIAVAWLAANRSVPAPRLIAVLGAAGFIAVALADDAGMFQQTEMVRIFLFGLAAATMLTGLVAAEANGSISMGRAGDRLGDLSYPLYLSHSPILSIVIPALAAHRAFFPPELIALAALVTACCVALLLNRLVERPAAKMLKRLWGQQIAVRYSV